MLRLRTLGTIDLAGDDGASRWPVLGQPRRLALLLHLATASPPGPRHRDALVALFWPELDHRHARAALRQTVHLLRLSLGEDVVAGRGTAVLAMPERLWCDVRAFEALLDDHRPAEALELYRGAFLPGFHLSGAPEFERWVEERRAVLRARAASAARALARRHEWDDPEAAAQWAGRAMALTPECERTLRQLLVLLARAGDRVGAARAFAEFARRAADDLGVEPSAETQRLVHDLLRSPAGFGSPMIPPRDATAAPLLS